MKSKLGLCFVTLLAPILASAQNLKEFEKKVNEFTLANGMHFIVIERHEAPVVPFNTYVKAGSLDDPAGQTGLAHMFEHMAFKGTPWIGSRNWPRRKKLSTRLKISTPNSKKSAARPSAPTAAG